MKDNMSTNKTTELALQAELSKLVSSIHTLNSELERITDDIEDVCMNSDRPEAVALKNMAAALLERVQR